MTTQTYLTAQLRDSAPYLKDGGWKETAKLLLVAADEIEALRKRLHELEPASAPQHWILRHTNSSAGQLWRPRA